MCVCGGGGEWGGEGEGFLLSISGAVMPVT